MEDVAFGPVALTASLKGRAVGVTFFTIFGGVWLLLGLFLRQQLGTASLTAVISAALGMLLMALRLHFAAGKLGSLMGGRNLKKGDGEAVVYDEASRARAAAFKRVNIAQYAAIGVVGFGFSKLHLDAYVFSAVTAIVGAHFFPLARLFRYPLHLVTGAAMVLWASFTVLALPLDQMQGTTAIGTGALLWASAMVTLGWSRVTMHRARNVGGASTGRLKDGDGYAVGASTQAGEAS